MLCQLTEARKVGRLAVLVCGDVIVCHSLQEVCYNYWPISGTQTYGEFRVELVKEEALTGFIMRTLNILNTKVHIHTCTLKHTQTLSLSLRTMKLIR